MFVSINVCINQCFYQLINHFCRELETVCLFVSSKKYFAGNYGLTLKKIESTVIVIVLVVISKSIKRFKGTEKQF